MKKSILVTLFILLSMQSFAEEKKYEENYYYQGMNKSMIEWDKLDPVDYLDYDLWLRDVKLKDKWPKWEKTAREKSHDEGIGKVLHCVSRCRFYRGVGFYSGQFRSTVLEGDEIHTGDDGYAWIFLFDGTMVRLSPNSSITFKEFNIGDKKNFIHARINSGNILWLSREREKFIETNERETDALFLPMSFYEALPVSRGLEYDEDDLINSLEVSKSTLNQYKRLNGLIEENNNYFEERSTLAFLVSPNGSVSGESLNIEFISLIGKEGYFKRRGYEQLGLVGEGKKLPASFYYRGFDNKDTYEIEEGVWYKLGQKGREIDTYEAGRLFLMGELMTKRIPTIFVARELLLKNYSEFLNKTDDERTLAREYGYRKWGALEDPSSDIKLRFDFLKEYTRRMETSNLLASQRLREKLEASGEKSDDMTYSAKFFNRALVEYYRGKNLDINRDSGKEVLNSTKKKFWKIINEIK